MVAYASSRLRKGRASIKSVGSSEAKALLAFSLLPDAMLEERVSASSFAFIKLGSFP
jgi:hypothetical protein